MFKDVKDKENNLIFKTNSLSLFLLSLSLYLSTLFLSCTVTAS